MTNGTLRSWALHQHHTGALQLRGALFGDTKGRFEEGAYVTTSAVVSIKDGVATTRNSSYVLDGAPAGLSLEG